MESDSKSDALVGTAAGSGSATEQFSDSSTEAEAENVTTDSSTPSTSSVRVSVPNSSRLLLSWLKYVGSSVILPEKV